MHIAQHVADEMVAKVSHLTPPSNEDLKKALTIAFPNFMVQSSAIESKLAKYNNHVSTKQAQSKS